MQTTTESVIRTPRGAPPRLGLYVLCGDGADDWLTLPNEALTLGRGPAQPPWVAFEDTKMSRSHCRVVPTDSGGWRVEDAGSKNGTWHQGEPADGRELRPQNVLRLGNTVLVAAWLPEAPSPDAGLLGQSRTMGEVRHRLERLAKADLTVLLTGETGTGKEVAARALHAWSGRTGRFAAVNCAAIPAPLLERELFGHAQGAFTGATRALPGWVEAARDGTLLLDEVSELPLDLQPKLLRYLDQGAFAPVGSTRERQADARIVAASNQDLLALVRARRFREDLYARLEGTIVHLPPLRERKEDLMILARAALAREPQTLRWQPDLVEALALHDWPRNVRELLNTLRGLAALTPAGEDLSVERLPAALQRPLDDRQPPAEPDPVGRDALRDLLERHEGNVKRVARAIGRERKTVYRWLKAFALDPGQFRQTSEDGPADP